MPARHHASPLHEERSPQVRGTVQTLDCHGGLSIHHSDAIDLSDSRLCATLESELHITVFIRGALEARLGDLTLPMARKSACGTMWTPVATVVSLAHSDEFVRIGRAGTHMRKVGITISPEWLDRHIQPGCAGHRELSGFMSDHLRFQSWAPSARTLAAIEAIGAANAAAGGIERFVMESEALLIVQEALRQVVGPPVLETSQLLSAREILWLRRVDDYVDHHDWAEITLDRLAREAGASVSTLQRFFRLNMKTSVFAYIRTRRLEQARQELTHHRISVTQAARLAGYTSLASFSTAFKRAYGTAPSGLR